MRPFILDSRGTFWIALGFLPLLLIHDMAVLDLFVFTLLRVLLTCYCLRYLTPLSLSDWLDEMNDSCASDQLLYLVSHSVCLGHISSVRPCLCYYYKQATEMNTNGTKTRKWVRQRRDATTLCTKSWPSRILRQVPTDFPLALYRQFAVLPWQQISKVP